MDNQDLSTWIKQLHQVDDEGAEEIWREYFPKLVRLAQRKMGNFPRRSVDEEDVALSAMNSFFRGAKAGRFELVNRDDLWKLLVTITARKVTKQRRRQMAEKRGGGQVRGESIWAGSNQSQAAFGIGQVLDNNMLPEMADQVANVCEELLSTLGDEKLKQTALLRMEGHTNAEIAEKMGCSVSRIKQRIARIKEKWAPQMPGAENE